VRLVGPSAAKQLLFTAQRVEAEEALALGLVNAVVAKAELEASVRRTAEQIAGNAPLTLASVKRVVRGLSPAPSFDDPGIARSVRACFESEDYQEGVRAVSRVASPRFRGRQPWARISLINAPAPGVRPASRRSHESESAPAVALCATGVAG
jgi:enoyl-CoA hydratase/carnithine racemase